MCARLFHRLTRATVVQELAKLFKDLMKSTSKPARPSQRLANAVLLDTRTLLQNPPTAELPKPPPPLPARPPPSPPSKVIELPDVEMTDISRTHVLESAETASNSSSRTLVDLDDAHSDHSYERVERVPLEHVDDVAEGTVDLVMEDAPEAETVDQKVLNALEHQQRSSGTDQQDVEEVMGSIINLLQAAIQPASTDERTGIQREAITETFFVTTVNYTKKFDEREYQSEVSFGRALMAFPAEAGPCSLYDALDRNFDQEILEEDKLARFTAIQKLPPVLHVLIQRSQVMGRKNDNAVTIPEILRLERYMDVPPGSQAFQRRAERWALANRVGEIAAQLEKLEKTGSRPHHASFWESHCKPGAASPPKDKDGASSDDVTNRAEDVWGFDGPLEDDEVSLMSGLGSSSVPEWHQSLPMSLLQGSCETEEALQPMMRTELREREGRLSAHRVGMQGTPYRLHAVICHRGHLTAGHYWVWIHDLVSDTWQKYNDEVVGQSGNTADVLNALSNSGEPYLLCYVRDEDKDVFVGVPERQAPRSPSSLSPPSSPPTPKATTTERQPRIGIFRRPPSPPHQVDIEINHVHLVEPQRPLGSPSAVPISLEEH